MNINELISSQREIFEKNGLPTSELTINRLRPIVLATLIGLENLNSKQQLACILDGVGQTFGFNQYAIDTLASDNEGAGKAVEDDENHQKIDRMVKLIHQTLQLFTIFLSSSVLEDANTWEIPPVVLFISAMNTIRTDAQSGAKK